VGLRVIRNFLYIVSPAIALWLAAPAALALAPWNLRYLDSLAPFHALFLAFYLGILAAPGYLFALVTEMTAERVSTAVRWWVNASLIVASLCSLAGLIASVWMILFGPPSLMALYASLTLLRQFERRPSRTAAECR
jgi:hypothetical protein